MFRRIVISKNDRGFVLAGRDYVRYLRPGAHWVFGWKKRVERARVTDLALQHGELEQIVKDPATWQDLQVVDLRDHERALVWIDGRLRCVLVPGRAAFWKTVREVRVETFDARAIRFEHESLEQALRVPGGDIALDSVVVPSGSTALLLVGDQVKDELGPGRFAWWKDVAPVRVVVLDRREQAFNVAGQEVVTKDKATVRLNVVVVYRIASIRRWVDEAVDALDALYREVQLALRGAVGARTLDELLVARDAVGLEVQASVARRAESLGATIGPVGLKDVVLPGELRSLVGQVFEAEKRAQANLIARREETAATRALLNTAKLYAENPTLLRLKELETAEKLAEKVTELRVGGLDELLSRLLPKTAS